MEEDLKPPQDWRKKLFIVMYRSDTAGGKLFDVLLLVFIIASIVIVFLDSVPSVHARHAHLLYVLEWSFTSLFALEYALRILCVRNRWKYIVSVLGIIDLISILPTFFSLLYIGSQYLLVVRSLRLLRVFRIFKLWHYIDEGKFIIKALYNSYRKINIFLLFIIIVVMIVGSIMYLLEGGRNGFKSIPDSIYWAVVTITTVGYGDISPVTPVGKLLATLLMLCGYSIIAVPTGIVSSEMAKVSKASKQGDGCSRCGADDHARDARYCRICGESLFPATGKDQEAKP
ncbi:MAG: ion transporter [Sphingobacteriales bacterium]|nr:MAG: ion transporter [Sphingobacteriales bacterium]